MSRKNRLEELYNGHIRPFAKSVKTDSDYYKYAKLVCDNEEKLNAYLKEAGAEQEKKLLDQLMDANAAIVSDKCQECFIDGWKLGARFMLDTFFTPHETSYIPADWE